MTTTIALVATALGGLAALAYAISRSLWISRITLDEGPLKRISGYIADGAQAFLRREYTVLVPFIVIVAAFLALANSGPLRLQALAFALGALCSATAGYFGMRVATKANARTALGASRGIGPALAVAFAGGSVMGMTVVGLALVGISAVFGAGVLLFGGTAGALSGTVFPILSGFSLGASTIALFARVGGGIFTKAADVGADLVGKVEAGIPEDDPRNPAVIADNVGDNVGDVAGMGADLFESYVGSIVGCVVLGMGAVATDATRIRLALLPLLMAAVGIGASLVGMLLVKGKPGASPQKALNAGTFGAAGLAPHEPAGDADPLLGDREIEGDALDGLVALGQVDHHLHAAAADVDRAALDRAGSGDELHRSPVLDPDVPALLPCHIRIVGVVLEPI